MPVFKNEDNGTWYVMARYVNWKGERKQKWRIKKKRLPRMYLLAQIRDSQFKKSLKIVYPSMRKISRVLRKCKEKCS